MDPHNNLGHKQLMKKVLDEFQEDLETDMTDPKWFDEATRGHAIVFEHWVCICD